jgi:AcrR family transcriptional regulator
MPQGPSRASAPRRDARTRTLTAARSLFTANGYKATTTKEIALRAGVAEPTLFRLFGSKSDLFEAAVLEPFSEFIDGWIRSWHEFNTKTSVEQLAESLVDGLFTLVQQDRRLFQELMEARADPENPLHTSALSISSRLREGLRAVHDVGLEIATDHHLDRLDPPATIASVAAMIIGAVVLEDWIVPTGLRSPSRARMIKEIAMLIAYGISGRPDR